MISIEYDDRRVQAALQRLAASARDMRPAMREIAAALEAEAQRSPLCLQQRRRQQTATNF